MGENDAEKERDGAAHRTSPAHLWAHVGKIWLLNNFLLPVADSTDMVVRESKVRKKRRRRSK